MVAGTWTLTHGTRQDLTLAQCPVLDFLLHAAIPQPADTVVIISGTNTEIEYHSKKIKLYLSMRRASH